MYHASWFCIIIPKSNIIKLGFVMFNAITFLNRVSVRLSESIANVSHFQNY